MRFNSATAHRRGERRGHPADRRPGPGASIRPRLTAVENAAWACGAVLACRASIRPRLTAVENSARGRGPRRNPAASIRPRLTAVENSVPLGVPRNGVAVLQFGHGSPPWRTKTVLSTLASEILLQFGHGSPPWR